MKRVYLLSIILMNFGVIISMQKAPLSARVVKKSSGKSAKKSNPKKTLSQAQQFIHASNSGDLKKVTKLIRMVDPNYQNSSKKTALHLAAFNGHVDVVAYLLAHGVDPNIRDRSGKTALDAAKQSSASSRKRIIALLSAQVPSAEKDTNNSETTDRSSIPSSSSAASTSSSNASSTSSGTQPTVKRNPKDLDFWNLAYKSLVAAESGDLNAVQEHIELGVDPNIQWFMDKKPALHLASLNGHVAVVEYLLAHGADPSIIDNEGNTALDEAKKSNASSRERVIALLNAQAPFAEKDTNNSETTDRSSTSSSSSATSTSSSNTSSTSSPRIKFPTPIVKPANAPASVIIDDTLLSTNQRFAVRPLFSPDDDLRSKLISLIDAEKKRISIAIYILSDKAIAKALIRAARRGVLVEGVVDRIYGEPGYHSKVCMLANAQIPLWVFQTSSDKSKTGLMHNKFMLFSQTEEGKALVWTGSYNFTMNANEKNQENIVIIENEALFETYTKSFERLKKRSLKLSGRC